MGLGHIELSANKRFDFGEVCPEFFGTVRDFCDSKAGSFEIDESFRRFFKDGQWERGWSCTEVDNPGFHISNQNLTGCWDVVEQDLERSHRFHFIGHARDSLHVPGNCKFQLPPQVRDLLQLQALPLVLSQCIYRILSSKSCRKSDDHQRSTSA